MTILLPTFEDSFCEMLGVCSSIVEAPKPLPDQSVDITASYSKPEKALVHLAWEPKSSHFHVDAALRTAFGKNPPKQDERLPVFRKLLASFEGASVKAILTGYFRIPLSSLPPAGGLIFTGNSAVRLRSGKSEIELTGANLSFRNADVSRIRWDIIKDVVVLEVQARRDLRVGPDYLVDALRVLEAATATYILGKKADD